MKIFVRNKIFKYIKDVEFKRIILTFFYIFKLCTKMHKHFLSMFIITLYNLISTVLMYFILYI